MKVILSQASRNAYEHGYVYTEWELYGAISKTKFTCYIPEQIVDEILSKYEMSELNDFLENVFTKYPIEHPRFNSNPINCSEAINSIKESIDRAERSACPLKKQIK